MPLTAKYPTTCGLCSLPVKPGDEIAKAGTRWAHVACAADGQQALPELADGAKPTGSPASALAASGKGGSGKVGSAKVTPVKRTVRKAPGPAMTAAPGALEVWTDGACSGNPGPGGWAWATEDGRQGSGAAALTTNQRMEIQAALEAVKALDGPLTVVSDSTYVVNCFKDGWWKGWLARGWVNSAKKPVANRDLWEPLITLVGERGNISFRWVKGHSGDTMNDLVDQLAVKAAKSAVG